MSIGVIAVQMQVLLLDLAGEPYSGPSIKALELRSASRESMTLRCELYHATTDHDPPSSALITVSGLFIDLVPLPIGNGVLPLGVDLVFSIEISSESYRALTKE